MTQPPARRGWLATSGGLAGAAAAGAVAMVAVTGGSQAPAAPAAPPVTTARVTRTTLVTTTLTEGTLGYTATRPVVNLLTGTYTQIPGPGRRIGPGGILFAVDDLPVVLMTGRIPAWRAMAPGIVGPDVTELERNLIALGYAGGLLSSPGDVWTAATTAAVDRWQQAAGLPVTGQIDLGRVLFLPGPVRTGAPAFAAGDPAAPGQAPYQVTTDHRVVLVPLNPVSAPRVTLGERVHIDLPSGVSAPGRVTAIGPAAPSGSGTAGSPGPSPAGSGQAATTVLTVSPAHPRRTGTASGVPVQVSLTTHVASGVLAVPVSALVALSGGGYGLEIIEPSGVHRLAGVRTGVFAGSLVQVSGPRITAGTTVVVAQ